MDIVVTLLGEEYRAQLLSSPDVLGVVMVRSNNDGDHRVHVSRCRALTDGARATMALGDRFVSKDPYAVIGEDPERTVIEPQLQGWTIEELEALRLLCISEVVRAQSRKRGALKRQAALSYVNLWLKKSRARESLSRFGMKDPAKADPIVLLRAIHEITFSLGSRLRKATGEGLTEEQLMVRNAVGLYLDHFAPAALRAESKRGEGR